MTRDEMMLHAFTRLADALSNEILNAPDAEIAEAVPSDAGRVAADRWRQRIRRIEICADEDVKAEVPVVPRDVDRLSKGSAP